MYNHIPTELHLEKENFIFIGNLRIDLVTIYDI